MKKLSDYFDFQSGSSQFRITYESSADAPTYTFYNQAMHEDSIFNVREEGDEKEVQTFDELTILQKGDLIFSLISGTSQIITKEFDGYYYSQNYVRLIPKEEISLDYVTYLLNENSTIKKQFFQALQGTRVVKYTVNQLRNLVLPKLPNKKRQETIGSVYRLHKRREKKVRDLEEKKRAVLIHALKEANRG